jgi:dTDP-4-amino-4,6-dideoxygalactose transaminase
LPSVTSATDRTRVIMPVDQLGLPCDIDAIGALARRHGLQVLDDAACAFGSFNNTPRFPPGSP